MTRAKMGLMTAIALGTLLLAPTLYAHERDDSGQMWGGATMGHGMWGGPMPGMMGMMRPPGPATEMMESCQQMMRVAGTAAHGAFDPRARPGRRGLRAVEFLADSITASSAKLSGDAEQSGGLLLVNDI